MTARPTARGLGVAVAGIAAFIAARGFGTPALALVGIGFVVAGVAALLVVAVAASRVDAVRTVLTRRPRAGEPVEVEVRVQGHGGGGAILAGVDWDVDAGLAEVGRAADSRRSAQVRRIRIPRARRGEHHLPPVRLRLADPFGLAVAGRTAGAGESLLVVPRTVSATADAGALGERRHARRARAGEDIANLEGLREYREGDPLSRVHWGQSAKRGRLHTKLFRAEDGGGRVGAVLLDMAPTEASTADVELAVSAAASLARAAAGSGGQGRGRTIALWTGQETGPAQCDWGEAEVRLARARSGEGAPLPEMLRRAVRTLPPGAGVVAVTADPRPGLAESARAARDAGLEAVVVLVGAAAAGGRDIEARGVPVARVTDADGMAQALGAALPRTRMPARA